MKEFFKKIIVKLNIINILSVFFYIFRIFKIKDNKIACTNFSGKGYSDNPKYIVEELRKNKNNDIVWFVKNPQKDEFPANIRVVKIYSIQYFYEMSTAKIWINNSRYPLFVRKRKKQFYVQTWHGGLGLKKVEKDAEETLSDYYKKAAPHDSKMIDIAISNSKYRTNIFKNSFWYSGDILECGSPRNDIFFDAKKCLEINKKVREHFNINNKQKIILYAPTFRLDSNFDYNSIDVNVLLEDLKKKYNEEYVFLIKLHPRFSERNLDFGKTVINASKYTDTDELLIATDILISDYSSIMFDFLYMKKETYLYAPDYENYIKERGINFKYKELPFSISYSSKELVEKIINKDYYNYMVNLQEFIKSMQLKDNGNASKTVAQLIEKQMNGASI